jgi:type II secretory pathway component PulF
MMTLVVPKLLDIFGDKTNLPVSTKILMSISDIFVNYWFFAVFFVLVFGVFLHMWKKTPD